MAVVRPAMQILATHRDKLKQPVWIHADIFEGPNMPEGAQLVDRDTFLVSFKEKYGFDKRSTLIWTERGHEKRHLYFTLFDIRLSLSV